MKAKTPNKVMSIFALLMRFLAAALILVVLSLLLSGCVKKVNSEQVHPVQNCHYEAQYTSPAPNSSLSSGDAGSVYTLVWVCD